MKMKYQIGLSNRFIVCLCGFFNVDGVMSAPFDYDDEEDIYIEEIQKNTNTTKNVLKLEG